MKIKEMAQDLMVQRPRKAVGTHVTAPRNHRVLNYVWGDYRIIERFTTCEPFVVCWMYDHTNHTWGQGHYFQTLEEAITYLYNLKHGK